MSFRVVQTLKNFVIPIIISTIIIISGFFAFMPVEKASTVHSTLATSASETTTQNLVASETDNQDRFATFRVNFTNQNQPQFGQRVTLIPASSGTITGFATVTAIANSANSTSTPTTFGLEKKFECGLVTTNSEKLGINATQGNSTSLALSNVLSADEGIAIQQSNSTSEVPGACIITLIIDSGTG